MVRCKAYFTTPLSLGQHVLMDYVNKKLRTIHWLSSDRTTSRTVTSGRQKSRTRGDHPLSSPSRD